MLPVIKELAGQGITVSIDTMHAEVAQAALENGAQIVNDVSGGRADPEHGAAARRRESAVGADALALGRRGPAPRGTRRTATWSPRSATNCWPASTPRCRRGVDPARLIIDPGLGFAKTAEHNWALLRALPEFVGTGIPVLVGASRKRFLGTLLADRGRRTATTGGRETATAVISALAGLHGAWGVRVHDVRASVDALKVLEAWRSRRWLIESSCAA